MAKLISEDEEIKSSFSLIFLEEKLEVKKLISWIQYKIVFQSGEKELVYEKLDNCGTGDYVLALTPINELENLISGINDFLSEKSKKMYSFEPVEPSFELIIERGHEGFSVVFWMDSGNVDSTHYAWDGFGLRFYTNEQNILNFLKELKKEKDELCQKEKI